jgi:hypothetical protein
MVPGRDLALGGNSLPQSAASLGIHVDFFVRYLSQPEMAYMVEGAITNRSSGNSPRSNLAKRSSYVQQIVPINSKSLLFCSELHFQQVPSGVMLNGGPEQRTRSLCRSPHLEN